MTKKEQAYVKELEMKISSLEARIFVPKKIIQDMPPPKSFSGTGLVKGWSFNTYNGSVYKTCSSSVGHGNGWDKTSSQNSISQFSTEILALQALAFELNEINIKKIAEIFSRISVLCRDEK